MKPLVAVVLFAALSAGGCGPRREPPGIVQGRVTNLGKPVTDAVIYFDKDGDDYSVFAPLDGEGAYQVKTFDYGGLPAGTYRIRLKPAAEGMTALAGDAQKKEPAHQLIPRRFQDVNTSGLRAEVQSGENPAFDFDLGKAP